MLSVDESTPQTLSIGGKVAALQDITGRPNWSNPVLVVKGITETSVAGPDSCDGKSDGKCNTQRIIEAKNSSQGTVTEAATACETLVSGGFADWFLPAICELGRYDASVTGSNQDAGCGMTNANLYSTLYLNSLGGLNNVGYWGSTEVSTDPNAAWNQNFGSGGQFPLIKPFGNDAVRCIRRITS